jgi:hypothetical protein
VIPRPLRQLLVAAAVTAGSWCLGTLVGATDPERTDPRAVGRTADDRTATSAVFWIPA